MYQFRLLSVFLAFALMPIAMPGLAQNAGLPVLPRDKHVTWTAIGRVNGASFAERGSCTGTLITSDTVLTAAHCVARKDGSPRPLYQVRFVAGWLQGEYIWYSAARKVDVHPNYHQTKGRRGLGTDLAIITLADPVPAPLISPLPLIPVSDQDSDFAIIGYQRTRNQMLSAQFNCPKLRDFGPVVLIDCPVISGLSGSPLLEKTDTGWAVAGVVVARAEKGDDGKAFAVWPNSWLLDTLAAQAALTD